MYYLANKSIKHPSCLHQRQTQFRPFLKMPLHQAQIEVKSVISINPQLVLSEEVRLALSYPLMIALTINLFPLE